MSYAPPAGVRGHAVAALFGADPESVMDAAPARMETLLETGRPPCDAAQPVAEAGPLPPAGQAPPRAGHPVGGI